MRRARRRIIVCRNRATGRISALVPRIRSAIQKIDKAEGIAFGFRFFQRSFENSLSAFSYACISNRSSSMPFMAAMFAAISGMD